MRAFLLFTLLTTPACKDGAQRITLTGSSTIAPLASEIAKRFESLHPNVRVDVQTGGSSRGVTDARSGTADIGMVSRALKEDERDLTAYTIARDGISLIVHEQNRIASITSAQIVDVYLGRANDWSALGGEEAPITVVNKAEGRSTLELFLHHFDLKSPDIRADVVIGDNEQGIKTVAGNRNAIAYVSIGTAEYDAKNGVPIKLLPLDGVEATVENVRKATFPLARPLNLVTAGTPTGVTKTFLEFARSKAVRDIVAAQQFVALERD